MKKQKNRRKIINLLLIFISTATVLSLIFKDYSDINIFGYVFVTSMVIIIGIILYLFMSSKIENHRRKQKLHRIKTVRRNLYNL